MTTVNDVAKKQVHAPPAHRSEEEQLAHQEAGETDFQSMTDFVKNSDPEMITSRTAIRLQRTIGNQAVLRLLEKQNKPANPSHTLINRYTTSPIAEHDSPSIKKWVKDYQRASANKGIFQISEQHIIASDAIIATSEAALLAQNSVVQLVKGELHSPGYSRVKVQARQSRLPNLKGDAAVVAMGEAAGKDGATNKAAQQSQLESRIATNNASIDAPLSANPEKAAEEAAAKPGMKEAVKNMEAEKVLLAHTGDTDLFLTIRDCHMTSRLIMGDVGIGAPGRRRERMEITDNTGANQSLLPKVEDTNSAATTANRGAIGVLKSAFNTFEAVLIAGGFGPGTPKAKADIIRDLKAVNAKWDYTAAMKLYKAIQSDADISTLFNKTYSVNEYAKVAIGQALVVVNDEREKKSADEGKFDGGRELWNYHWAGVILMDGNDYVTLEAVADQNATTLTTDWKFKMYGMIDRGASDEEQAAQAEQTFHGNQKTDTHTGTAPLTIGVSARA